MGSLLFMKSSKVIILFVCKQQWWRNVFQSRGEQVPAKKTMEFFFFIQQFALTIDPMLIVLLKTTIFKQNSKFKSGAY